MQRPPLWFEGQSSWWDRASQTRSRRDNSAYEESSGYIPKRLIPGDCSGPSHLSPLRSLEAHKQAPHPTQSIIDPDTDVRNASCCQSASRSSEVPHGSQRDTCCRSSHPRSRVVLSVPCTCWGWEGGQFASGTCLCIARPDGSRPIPASVPCTDFKAWRPTPRHAPLKATSR